MVKIRKGKIWKNEWIIEGISSYRYEDCYKGRRITSKGMENWGKHGKEKPAKYRMEKYEIIRNGEIKKTNKYKEGKEICKVEMSYAQNDNGYDVDGILNLLAEIKRIDVDLKTIYNDNIG